jgi:hypothetical protein
MQAMTGPCAGACRASWTIDAGSTPAGLVCHGPRGDGRTARTVPVVKAAFRSGAARGRRRIVGTGRRAFPSYG